MCCATQDPLEVVRQKCEEVEHCVHTRERLEECETRVGSRSSTEEDCTEELFDFLHARDHCVSLTIVNCRKQSQCLLQIQYIHILLLPAYSAGKQFHEHNKISCSNFNSNHCRTSILNLIFSWSEDSITSQLPLSCDKKQGANAVSCPYKPQKRAKEVNKGRDRKPLCC